MNFFKQESQGLPLPASRDAGSGNGEKGRKEGNSPLSRWWKAGGCWVPPQGWLHFGDGDAGVILATGCIPQAVMGSQDPLSLFPAPGTEAKGSGSC